MNTWRPTSESELWDMINFSWEKMSIAQRRVWELIKICPMKWQEDSYGKLGGGFWVVAMYGSTVLWYNDIEDGFNYSSWTTLGKIDEYLCSQTSLHEVIGESIGGCEPNYRVGPPEPLN